MNNFFQGLLGGATNINSKLNKFMGGTPLDLAKAAINPEVWRGRQTQSYQYPDELILRGELDKSKLSPMALKALESGKMDQSAAMAFTNKGYVPAWAEEMAQQPLQKGQFAEAVKGMATQPQQVPSTSLPLEGQITPEQSQESPYSGIGDLAKAYYKFRGHGDKSGDAAIIAEGAAKYGIDPYLAIALSAQEGGWLNAFPKDAPYNYLGWGETDSGGMQKGAQSLQEWVDRYFPDIAKQYGPRQNLSDWGGSGSGYSKASKFGDRYNYNDSWYDAISSIMRDIEAYRDQEGLKVKPSPTKY